MAVQIIAGDCRSVLATLPDASVNCVVTSPPYFGLRNYGVEGQMGLEPTPDEYVAALVAVFREVRRVLRADGTLWLNLGDSYASAWPCSRRNAIGNGSLPNGKREARPSRLGGLKEKDLIGIPWRVAFALQADGWWLRSDIVWSKPNPMPESVTDRPTRSHEYIFLLSKSARYYYDADAVRESAATDDRPRSCWADRRENEPLRRGDPSQSGHITHTATLASNAGRNLRSVWTVATQPFSEAHFATFPPALIEPCIKAGCPEGGTVLDPFFGAGTTGLVCDRLGRNCIGIELNPAYAEMAQRRIEREVPLLANVELSQGVC